MLLSQALKSLDTPQNPELDQALPRQIPAILTFLKRWQEYLTAKGEGDQEDARDAVKQVLASDPPGAFMPRSEWLQIVLAAKREEDAGRKQPYGPTGIEKQADDILSAVEELDDLNPSLKKLRELQAGSGSESKSRSFPNSSGSSSRTPLAALIESLQFLDKNYQELKAGLPVSLALQAPSTGSSSRSLEADVFAAHTARLKAAYLTLALPRFLGLPEDMKPDADESFTAYVKKAARSRGEAAGPQFLLRCHEALFALERGDARRDDAEAAGIKAYLTTRNQEAAGRQEEAVYAYLDALHSNHELLPVEAIGKRLRALEEAHPEAYSRGAARFRQAPERGRESGKE